MQPWLQRPLEVELVLVQDGGLVLPLASEEVVGLWGVGDSPDGVGVLGAVAVALGLLLGFSPGGDCGSPWAPDTSKVESEQRVDALTKSMAGLPREQQTDPAVLCDARFGSRGILATGLAVLGGVMAAGAVMVRHRGQGASGS